MRKYTIPQSMSVEYMLGDHLGSTSITTDVNGAKVSEMRYKPWGEVRYSWTSGQSTTPTYTLPKYTFTGQYSYTSDFGLMFYNARWYDPAIGRFAQADTIVPDGIQGWDRYVYVGNNPINFNDPSGHLKCKSANVAEGDCEDRSTVQILQEEYGITLNGAFTEIQISAIYKAARTVGAAFAQAISGGMQTVSQAFKAVFKDGINFVLDPNCNGCRHGTILVNQGGKWVDTGKPCGSDYTSPGCVPGGGFTAGTTITFASMSGQTLGDLDRMIKNVVHELGHVYYHIIGGPDLGNSFSRDALRPNEPAGQLDWQQHPDADGGELFADTFIAWVYDAWNTDTDPQIVDAVNSARTAMDDFAKNTLVP